MAQEPGGVLFDMRVFIALILFSNTLLAQVNNLVYNGGFEIAADSCKNGWQRIFYADGWDAAMPENPWNQGSTDLYHKCYLSIGGVDGSYSYGFVRDNIPWKYGRAVAGFYIGNLLELNREYLQTKLVSALEPDSIYIFECSLFSFSHSQKMGHGTNDRFGILVSNERVSSTLNFTPILLEPTAETPPGVFLDDTLNWTAIKFTFKAKGGEQYLTFGNFRTNAETQFKAYEPKHPNGITIIAYYFIDEVKLYKASDTLPKPELVPILPNVFSPNQDGINDIYEVENLPQNGHLQVYNRWGTLVYEQRSYNNLWQGQSTNGNELAEGVYFVLLTYTNANNEVKQLKQTVHLVR